MLQRIQTVFLLLVAICMLVTFFLPFWSYEDTEKDIYYSLYSLQYEQNVKGKISKEYYPYTFIAALSGLSIIVALFGITRYSNRLFQIKLGALNSLLIAVSLILAAYFATDFVKELKGAGNYGLAFFMPAAALFFNLLANRYIRKDEKLVRSVDRIR
ncbi:MAG: DUF4293 domain-containing protein [Bacteroidota bacterium]